MKKVKVWLAAALTVILSLFCLAGCGKTGVYKVTAYKTKILGVTSTVEVEDSESFVELKNDDTAKMSIDIAKIVTLEGEGTWKEGEEKNSYVITISDVDYNATIEDGVMTIDLKVASVVLEKE